MNPSIAVIRTDGIPPVDLGIIELERVDIPDLFK
jgi:hypothetical protein